MDLGPVRTVLCAVDLSTEGDEAIRQAHALATLLGAELVAFHAMPSMTESAPLFPTGAQADATAFVGLQRRVLEALAARVHDVTGRSPEAFRVELGTGTAHAAIVQAAERLTAGLIVVGGAGAKGVARQLLGAVAERVVRAAHCPVWVAHPGAGDGAVVAATDFSPAANQAVALAADLAQRQRAPLAVVHALSIDHVLPVGAEPAWSVWTKDELSKLRADARAHLDSSLAKGSFAAEAVIADTAPATAVLKLAEERRARVICVGTVGRTGLRRMMLGSVAEEVVRRARCPVLVVRST
jgi:nucleotide-binding universal stress UspA family protein